MVRISILLFKLNIHEFQNLAEGNMAIVTEDNVPSYGWRLGRIQGVYPGSNDKHVQSRML